MRDLLFLAHRIPYPPNKGDKIRAWHLLQHFAARRRVHLGCFVDDPTDWAHVPRLAELCATTCVRPLDRRKATLRSLPALLGAEPLTTPYYRDARLAEWTRKVRRDRAPTTFVYSSSMAQYVMDADATDAPRLIDFVDVDSAKWTEYAAHKPWPLAAVYRREGEALQRLECRVAREFDASFFVSDAEAELFRRLAPQSAAHVHAVSNGVDCARFAPAEAGPDPYDGAGADVLCFTGMMDYWPNVDAVVWFVGSILPLVRRARRATSLWIVGANPSAAVRRLAREPGVVVTGRVADTRPYIAHAAAVVAPLRIARGIQNKVLEAMAMGKPVVASAPAFEGIGAEPGRDLLVAADEDGFAAAVLDAVDPGRAARIGAAARRLVETTYGWDEQLARLDHVVAELESGRAPSAVRRIA